MPCITVNVSTPSQPKISVTRVECVSKGTVVSSVAPNQPFKVVVYLQNTGNASGTANIRITINNTEKATGSVSVPANGSTTWTSNDLTISTAGTYQICAYV